MPGSDLQPPLAIPSYLSRTFTRTHPHHHKWIASSTINEASGSSSTSGCVIA
ncbi:hypothetical protein ARMSODRAFT_214142 [Armillaria solidipes]|uniref:Uncharacterized protein n=1 Tax=Armillaria solidipes TaxID=1076256 RepID=A0A2H3BBQ1_9AGAR|nr:hypothetical protein ARMSODRAFT_214142 [Armillaria solidipes]